MLTKAQEKEMFARMIADCPAGYVRDILKSIKLDVECAITSDFAFVDLAMYRQLQAEADRHLAELQKRANELRNQVEELERARFLLANGLTEVRSIVRKLSNV